MPGLWPPLNSRGLRSGPVGPGPSWEERQRPASGPGAGWKPQQELKPPETQTQGSGPLYWAGAVPEGLR